MGESCEETLVERLNNYARENVNLKNIIRSVVRTNKRLIEQKRRLTAELRRIKTLPCDRCPELEHIIEHYQKKIAETEGLVPFYPGAPLCTSVRLSDAQNYGDTVNEFWNEQPVDEDDHNMEAGPTGLGSRAGLPESLSPPTIALSVELMPESSSTLEANIKFPIAESESLDMWENKSKEEENVTKIVTQFTKCYTRIEQKGAFDIFFDRKFLKQCCWDMKKKGCHTRMVNYNAIFRCMHKILRIYMPELQANRIKGSFEAYFKQRMGRSDTMPKAVKPITITFD
uniref:DUF4806 domain-containing protein n=1 Tax=Anopheles albimanus TaxID=7167 RepID=A0A182FWX1_ANOAL